MFLRSLASEYQDMELLSRGIQDSNNAAEAISAAKEFRRLVRDCDDAVSSRDLKKVIELYPKTTELFDKYLGYLQDIPSEL